MENKIKILLVEDHKIVSDGIKNLLLEVENFELIACVTNGKEAIDLLEERKNIEIVITDISMPIINGIELTNLISQKYPEIKVLILTMYNTEDYIVNSIKSGAKGYLPKQDTTKEVLIEAINSIYNGEEYFSPTISKIIMKNFVNSAKKSSKFENVKKLSLTHREKEILKMFAEGNTNQEIADFLNISIRTVETHKNNIMMKYDFKSTVEMVKFAIKNNIVDI